MTIFAFSPDASYTGYDGQTAPARIEAAAGGTGEAMELYFAPLEGITGYLYRNAYQDYFSGIDKYFTPFLSPNRNRALNPKEIRDILPENNKAIPLVPQILTNCGEFFLRAAQELEEKYGYEEVNLNLGCPSRTVAAKGKGAGFLAKPEELDCFFQEVFEKIRIRVSVKTRIGVDEPEEFRHLMKIFNKYPLHELIIHPRVQKDYYENSPDWKVFGEAAEISRNPVCYNGDIFTVEDFKRFRAEFPKADRVMLGRGLLRNPLLAEEIKREMETPDMASAAEGQEHNPAGGGWVQEDVERMKDFHDRLYADYRSVMYGEKNVLFKMKEFWVYAGFSFPGAEKCLKKIKKASRLAEYEGAVGEIWGWYR